MIIEEFLPIKSPAWPTNVSRASENLAINGDMLTLLVQHTFLS